MILVVFVFLRDVRATLIPSVAVPVSLIGTFGVMYLFGYSLDNLSLMALTIATGFVVDDAIVVLENVSRHMEEGMSPMKAAIQGAGEVGFTVLSMSVSLVAVFIPILLMGGMVGRLFREFAVTLSAAVLISLVVSLTTTPMLCARILRPEKGRTHGRLYRASERAFEWLHGRYDRSLSWALRHPRIMIVVTLATVALNIYLFVIVPKGFFPQQDTGRLAGSIEGAQDISFQAMREKLEELVAIVQADPAVQNVLGFTGGGLARNTARVFAALKPLDEREHERRPGHRPPARQARHGAGRHPLPAGGAGRAHRRPLEQCSVPVHAAGRKPRGALRLGAARAPAAARASAAGRREQRPAQQGDEGRAHDRSQHCLPPRA